MQSQSLALGNNSLLLEMGHTGKDVVMTSMGGKQSQSRILRERSRPLCGPQSSPNRPKTAVNRSSD